MTDLIKNVPDWEWDATVAASIAKQDPNTQNFGPDDNPWSVVNVNEDYCLVMSGDWWRWQTTITLKLMKRGGTMAVRLPDTGAVDANATKTADYTLHTVASVDIPNSLTAHRDQCTRHPIGVTVVTHLGIVYAVAFVQETEMSSTLDPAFVHAWVYEVTLAGEASTFSAAIDDDLFTFPNNYYATSSTVKDSRLDINVILPIEPDGNGSPRVLLLGDKQDDNNATGFTRSYTSDYFASVFTFWPQDNGGPEITHEETYFGNAMVNGTSSFIAPIIGADRVDANTVGYVHMQQNDQRFYVQFLDLTTMTIVNQIPGVGPIPSNPNTNSSRPVDRINVVGTGPNVPYLTVYDYIPDPSEVPPFGYHSLRSKGDIKFYSYSATSNDPIAVTTHPVAAQYADTSTVTGTMDGTDGLFLGTDPRTTFCQLSPNGKMLALAYGYPEWTAGDDPDYNWADTYSYEITVGVNNGLVTFDKSPTLVVRRSSLIMQNGHFIQKKPQSAAFTSDYVALIIDPTYWDYGSEPVSGASNDWNSFDYHQDVLCMFRVPATPPDGGSSGPTLSPPGPLWLDTSMNARPDGASTKFKGSL